MQKRVRAETCLICGYVDKCKNITNNPKGCPRYLKRATRRNLIDMGVINQPTTPVDIGGRTQALSPELYRYVKYRVRQKQLNKKYYIRFRDYEVYFRPRDSKWKKWSKIFDYEKNKL